MQTGQPPEHSPERWRAHEWLFLGLVVALPLLRPLTVKPFGVSLTVADAMSVVAALAWLAAILTGRAIVRRSRFYLPLGAYLLAVVVSALASDDPRWSPIKLVGAFYLVGLAVLTFNLVTSPSRLRAAANAWLVGTALTVAVSLLGVVLFYAGVRTRSINLVLHPYGSLPPGNYPRIHGLFFYPAMLCNYLGISLMLVIGMRAAGWLDAFRFRLFVVGICVTSLFTLSPGLGGMFLSVGLWAYLRTEATRHRRFGRLSLICGLSVALAFLAAASVSLFAHGPGGYVSSRLDGVEPSHRARVWQMAFDTFTQYPLFGRGIGTEIVNFHFLTASGVRQHLTDAHHVWLNIAAQEGLFGLTAFAALTAFVLKKLGPFPWPLRRDSSPHVWLKTALALALIDALLYQGLVGAFEDTRHLWVLFGMLAAAGESLPRTGQKTSLPLKEPLVP